MRRRHAGAVALVSIVMALTGCDSDHSPPAVASPAPTATFTLSLQTTPPLQTPTATAVVGTPTQTPTATSTCPTPDTTPTDEEFGAELLSADAIAQAGKCPPAAALAARAQLSTTPPPRATIPPTLLPPVQAQGTSQTQGSPGSCEVWSAGYAMGSYAANLTNQQPLSDLSNTVSPGFLYPWVLNKEGKTCGMPTAAPDTLNYLVQNTAPSLAAVPYSPNCFCLGMVDINQTFTTDLAIGSWCFFPPSAADALSAIKSYVAQGYVVQTSILVPWEFGGYHSGVFDAPTACPNTPTPPPVPTPSPTPGKPVCGQHDAIACVQSMITASGCAQHGIAIVGYDDTMVGPDGNAGAVLIMNSFGPGWGENGFMWMAYGGFEDIYLAGTLAFAPQPSGGLGAPFAVNDAFQWVEQRAGQSPRTHLIVEAAFAEPLPDAEVLITAPELRTVRQHYTQPFRHGYLYLTRTDGKQFEPGRYVIQIRGVTAGGLLTAATTIDLDPASALPAAELPSQVTGSNGQPATIDATPLPTP